MCLLITGRQALTALRCCDLCVRTADVELDLYAEEISLTILQTDRGGSAPFSTEYAAVLRRSNNKDGPRRINYQDWLVTYSSDQYVCMSKVNQPYRVVIQGQLLAVIVRHFQLSDKAPYLLTLLGSLYTDSCWQLCDEYFILLHPLSAISVLVRSISILKIQLSVVN